MTNIFVLQGDVCRDVKSETRGECPTIRDGRLEYYVFANIEDAGGVVRKRWEDMANNDRKEFQALIGDERLVGWALGVSDSFGISSLEEFLDISAANPQDDLASYDGEEREGKINMSLAEDLDIVFDDDAAVDYDMLRADIVSGNLDSMEFPGEWCVKIEEIVLDETMDNNWDAIRSAIEENKDGEFNMILEDYKFMDVVVYRSN